MKAIGSSLNDLDLVVYPFQLTGMDGMVTVVENPVVIFLEHDGELAQMSVFQATGQGTPLIKGLVGPSSGSVRPDVFELVS